MKKLLVLLFVVIFASLSLVACFFPNAEKATEKLEAEDYEVEELKKAELKEFTEMLGIKASVEEAIAAYNEEEETYLIVFYFESKGDAADFAEDLEKALDDEEAAEMLEMMGIDAVEANGKAVMFGSKKAMKILK